MSARAWFWLWMTTGGVAAALLEYATAVGNPYSQVLFAVALILSVNGAFHHWTRLPLS